MAFLMMEIGQSLLGSAKPSLDVGQRQARAIQDHKADQNNCDLEPGILFLNKRFHCRFDAVSIVQNLNSASDWYVF
jgi:hypothetical protein